MENSETTTGSRFSIVRKIKALLNLGEEGKLESFFTKVEKALKNDIKAAKQELGVLKFGYDSDMDKLNDELEDAKAAYEDSFFAVELSEIENNASQTDYVARYNANISAKERVVASVEARIERRKEEFKEVSEANTKEVAALQARLDRVSATAEQA